MLKHGIIRSDLIIQKPVRAAQYVRMSTDHQKYSIPSQVDAIAEYAAQRGYVIVRTYQDEGRSGLHFNNRSGLKELIADVRGQRADYRAILVYDVSRWGRFQDVDESAYYEFICKEAGVRVHYCAELFENDGSMASVMMKGLKRAMAGEFSRELSVKVFITQCRVTREGLWRGGPAGFGLRRHMVEPSGELGPRMELGQHKSLQTHRVILKPGPKAETEAVAGIFRSFVDDRKTVTEIAEDLNTRQIATARGNSWCAQTVTNILTNEAYAGHIIFNRKSTRLRERTVANPPEMWVRRDNAIEPIVSKDIFVKAQTILAQRRHRLSNNEMLDRLSALWCKEGKLTEAIVENAKGIPGPSSYIKHFGSIAAAYRLIGYPLPTRYFIQEIKASIRSVINAEGRALEMRCKDLGAEVCFVEESRQITLNGAAVSVAVARRLAEMPRKRRWELRWGDCYARPKQTDLLLVIKMDESNTGAVGYYLVPTKLVERALVRDGRLRITRRVFTHQYWSEDRDALVSALLLRSQSYGWRGRLDRK